MTEASQDGSLVDFVADVMGEGVLRVEETLGSGFVKLRVSEAERRQAKHDIRWVEDVVIELLRNARDAGAHTIFFATAREGTKRTLVCIDDGCGVPAPMRDRIFEARVTSKLNTMCMDRWGVHGRGMALFSIRQNALEAYVASSMEGGGSSFVVASDCGALPERADQSTWPSMGTDEEGQYSAVRGPHNIVRTAVEFAVDVRHECTVYFGTPTEILATMYGLALPFARSCEMDPPVVLWRLPALQPDAPSLRAQASAIGLEVSERTCYRIMNGEIAPLEPLMRTVAPQRTARPIDLERDCRGLKVAQSDLDDFSAGLKRSFRTLGDRYFLDLRGEPHVRVTRDSVTVVFEFDKLD